MFEWVFGKNNIIKGKNTEQKKCIVLDARRMANFETVRLRENPMREHHDFVGRIWKIENITEKQRGMPTKEKSLQTKD